MTRATGYASRGQILVIVAVGMIVLIGIAALVIDLGFSWMLRRQEQNAADPAALAAARFISEPDPVTRLQTYDANSGWDAACRYARMNGFFSPSNVDCDPETDGTSMTVNWPPQGTVSDYWHGDRGHVQVIITARHDSFFGRIFGQSQATVSTGAVAARQRGNTNSHSLIALKPEGCGTAILHGTSTISLYPAPGYTGDGGYVQVNSSCGSNSANDDCHGSDDGALRFDGGAILTAPKVNVHGGCNGPIAQPACPTPPGMCSPLTGPLDEAAIQIGDPLSGLVFPSWDTSLSGARCGQTGAATTSAGAQGCGQGGGRIPWAASPDAACPGMPASHDCIELDPGIYYGGWDIGSRVQVTLKPGIYVIAGGGITIGSTGSLNSLGGASIPAPILIYNTDNPIYKASCPSGPARRCQQNLDLTAQADLKLAGLRADHPCPPVTITGGCPFGGMLIWHDGDGTRAADGASCATKACIDISGGGVLDISGTIYAPTAHVNLTGNVDTNCSSPTQTAAVQMISWTWDIGGTGDICMPYDPTKLFKMVQQGLVH